ncbi:OmpW family protein [Roseococcus sp. SYP-B2431]|uniref:OmpW/AlkL family protein n=1 Tax=Roseococcus sp. SYP-B2431 TaxID=2496640 RepID=UPI00103D7262|nr:OmpW family outer membrane protein [Roseococcus sp. SYP-B2431]TCH97678.1 OmpW family protein [Roseococcus sp. SYP-B2431]
MRIVGYAAAAMLALGAGAASGQDAVRGKQAGDIVVGLGAIGVLPTNGGHVGRIGGTPTASNSASPQLDVSYFFTPNLSQNLIAATTQHDVSVRNSALGNVRLGDVWALPPTLTLQYHPLPRARISPYLGLGLNVTWFYGEGGRLTAPVNRVRIDPTVGVAPNIGVDYEIRPNWLLNLDAKWILMQPDVSVNSGLIRARADINPFVVGASVRYRF